MDVECSKIGFSWVIFEGTKFQEGELHISNKMIGLSKMFRDWILGLETDNRPVSPT